MAVAVRLAIPLGLIPSILSGAVSYPAMLILLGTFDRQELAQFRTWYQVALSRVLQLAQGKRKS